MKNLIIVVIFGCILFSAIISSGCIKLIHKDATQDTSPQSTENPSSPADGSFGSPGLPASTSVTSVNTPENRVDPADPILPADYQHEVRNLSGRNGEFTPVSLQSSLDSRKPLYQIHFSPQFNATAIKVNVTHGPLVIQFKATPKINDPRISYAVVTVRDLSSKAVLAEERIDRYPEKSDSDTTDTSLNEKTIELFREGMFHINVYGNQCDVDLSVYSNDNSPASTASPTLAPVTSQQGSENYDLG